MQTKNINIEQAPLNNLPQKLALTALTSSVQPQKNHIAAATAERYAPPLPPRAAIIFTPLPETPLRGMESATVEVEGYGPYKPVPPPKPLQQSNSAAAGSGCFTPPPYRMPPYPLYSEPSIPGAAAGDQPTPAASTPHGLHTHSSKFPIEREVILSSGDKNSKIPILNEYKKRSKVAIAPDVPPKQMAAWTQGQQMTPEMQNHSGLHIQTSQLNTPQNSSDHNAVLYRTAYHSPHEYIYNGGQNASSSTGAVPRTTQQWQECANKSTPNRQYQQEETNSANTQSVSVVIEQTKDSQKDAQKNSKSMTKTYHTLKDMISSRFKTGKDNIDGDKSEELGLNNVAEELRKSVRSVDRLNEESEERNGGNNMMKKTAGEQGIYGKPRTEQRSEAAVSLQQQQHQYNQHVMQQQMLHTQQLMQSQQAMQQQYQQQQSQQFKNQQQQQQYSQLVQARSQEMLTPRSHQPTPVNQDAVYYYGATPQRPAQRYGMQQTPDQTYVMMHHPQFGEVKVSARDVINERCVDDRRAMEPRSPQQLERDNIKQKSFEARRTASQPQLAFDDENKSTRNENNKLLNQATPIRRGSHGNLIESCKSRIESEKDSDDGGFITRSNSKERKLDHSKSIDNIHHNDITANHTHHDQENSESIYNKDDSKVIETLTGSPRKRLEGEIGKIEGVYNVGQRIRALNGENLELGEKRGSHRKPNGSGASSDYDKTGGQSSNADSGRGSAAYSSGRRVGNDTSTESSDTHQLPSANYRESALPSGHDPEWVDIVENELRHILEPKLHELSLQGTNVGVANSTVSESISSMTPPLPPLSPGEGSSPNVTPRNSARYKHSSLPYGSKPEYGMDSYNKPMKGTVGPGVGSTRWHGGSSQKHRVGKKLDHSSISKGKQIFGLDTTDITSTTTRSLDLESMLDGQTDSDGDVSTTDARAIRKQLEGLESMYSEVLKLLGVKKHSGRYQPSDPRFSKRRYGSMSSLPSSSVSSRPIRDKRRAHDDRKKVKDIRGINKRFQRLESHVVTLARSVAHLSSEMRTQHLMIQEMENIRGEISALRTQTNMLNVRSQSASRVPTGSKDLPSLANPTRVKKLTKFFGDEPPLLRLFLKKLGYEKYANVFENERVGMVELPYLSEERLQKMGVPLGPRLRIMQEAQISVCKDNTLCIV